MNKFFALNDELFWAVAKTCPLVTLCNEEKKHAKHARKHYI